MKAFVYTCLLVWLCAFVQAQPDTVMLVGRFSTRYADKVVQKAEKVEEGLTRQSHKALSRLQKQQQKVYEALHRLDSNAAKVFLVNSQQQYAAMLTKLNGIGSNPTKAFSSYVPQLGSVDRNYLRLIRAIARQIKL